ncbi:hypothetical protein CRE_28223 [Caenorhabditis remanei]|uniref:Uncharacterized protein n=1 Tax=Caenorhabditis remanei TaxID=31234 RepID=E3LLL9_CAERE|nr:hypothetical protein CRE_28223 [Caenorhabditis remanei]
MSTPSRNRATVPQRGTVAAAAAAAAIAVHPPVRCRASTNSYRVVRRRIENRKIRKRMFDAIRRYSQVKWGFCDGKHRFQGRLIFEFQNTKHFHFFEMQNFMEQNERKEFYGFMEEEEGLLDFLKEIERTMEQNFYSRTKTRTLRHFYVLTFVFILCSCPKQYLGLRKSLCMLNN